MKTIFYLFLIGVSAISANANTPLSASYMGVDYISVTGSPGYSFTGCVSIGCGGEFGGVITATQGGLQQGASVAANFWCVDSQEDFSFGNQGYADVVRLSKITSTSQDVRYANVADTGNPHWTYTTGLPSAARTRYEMAAWLVQQYTGFPDSIAASGQDDTIQKAIWDITSNTNYPNSTDAAGLHAADAQWVQTALNCYNKDCAGFGGHVNANQWAVVSWNADANGVLGQTGNRQTFLVQAAGIGTTTVTPEPGLYAMLGFGLAAIGVVSRRKTSTRS